MKFISWVREIVPNLIEEFILKSRYLLVVMYMAMVAMIVTITEDMFRILMGDEEAEHQVIAHTMMSLNLIDITMIANLVWFISAGSYYVFVHPHGEPSSKKKPRSLMHLSTGILKEKTAGSVVGVSAIILLQFSLRIAQNATTVNWNTVIAVGALIGAHLAFVVSLKVFNQTNAADHRQSDDTKPATGGHEREPAHAHA
jgi:uncharacterized protein (TIGR00645 family)